MLGMFLDFCLLFIAAAQGRKDLRNRLDFYTVQPYRSGNSPVFLAP